MTNRVLRYLEAAETAEIDPDYQDSYRLAWITLCLAYQDQPFPLVTAFYAVYGCAPDQLAAKVDHNRRIRLGRWYEEFWGFPQTAPPTPRKTPQGAVKPAVKAARAGSA